MITNRDDAQRRGFEREVQRRFKMMNGALCVVLLQTPSP